MDWQLINPDDRPQVEILKEGQWFKGEVKARRQVDDRWQGYVVYSRGPGRTHVDTFDESEIRPDEHTYDRSACAE